MLLDVPMPIDSLASLNYDIWIGKENQKNTHPILPTKPMLLGFIYLACRMTRASILPCDLTRWCQNAVIPYLAIYDHLPKQYKDNLSIQYKSIFKKNTSLSLYFSPTNILFHTICLATSLNLSLPPVNAPKTAFHIIQALGWPINVWTNYLTTSCIYRHRLSMDQWDPLNQRYAEDIMAHLIVCYKLCLGWADWRLAKFNELPVLSSAYESTPLHFQADEERDSSRIHINSQSSTYTPTPPSAPAPTSSSSSSTANRLRSTNIANIPSSLHKLMSTTAGGIPSLLHAIKASTKSLFNEPYPSDATESTISINKTILRFYMRQASDMIIPTMVYDCKMSGNELVSIISAHPLSSSTIPLLTYITHPYLTPPSSHPTTSSSSYTGTLNASQDSLLFPHSQSSSQTVHMANFWGRYEVSAYFASDKTDPFYLHGPIYGRNLGLSSRYYLSNTYTYRGSSDSSGVYTNDDVNLFNINDTTVPYLTYISNPVDYSSLLHTLKYGASDYSTLPQPASNNIMSNSSSAEQSGEQSDGINNSGTAMIHSSPETALARGLSTPGVLDKSTLLASSSSYKPLPHGKCISGAYSTIDAVDRGGVLHYEYTVLLERCAQYLCVSPDTLHYLVLEMELKMFPLLYKGRKSHDRNALRREWKYQYEKGQAGEAVEDNVAEEAEEEVESDREEEDEHQAKKARISETDRSDHVPYPTSATSSSSSVPATLPAMSSTSHITPYQATRDTINRSGTAASCIEKKVLKLRALKRRMDTVLPLVSKLAREREGGGSKTDEREEEGQNYDPLAQVESDNI